MESRGKRKRNRKIKTKKMYKKKRRRDLVRGLSTGVKEKSKVEGGYKGVINYHAPSKAVLGVAVVVVVVLPPGVPRR